MIPLPRVLSHPPRHDYVDRLHPHACELVHRDESWPAMPRFHDPGWVRRHADEWDVAHLHFAWEQYDPDELDAVLAAHRDTGTPVVWTVHDLRNPHVPDPDVDVPYLERLAAAVDAVVTLTSGAAEEVWRRFRRRAEVVPHGPLVPLDTAARMRAVRRRPGPLRVLLLAKSLRPNLDWETPLEVAATLGDDVRFDVHLHPRAPARDEVLAVASGAGVDVSLESWLSSAALRRRVAEADVLLLPYRWGTHSGLLELATDVGTTVVAGDVGHLAEQAPCHTVPSGPAGVDGDALRDVLARLAADGPDGPAVPLEERARQLVHLRGAHARLYTRLSDRVGVGTGAVR